MITDTVEDTVSSCISEDQPAEEWDLQELNSLLLPIIPLAPVELKDNMHHMKRNDLIQQLKEDAVKLYEAKEAEFPEIEQLREIERVILLKVIDHKWMDHIDDMDQLRQGIGLQAYGQRQPIVEYKFQGFEMFDALINSIREDTIKALMHVRIEQKVEREQVAKVTGTNRDDSVANAPIKRTGKKIQPNDPCPCGSGRKYKHCCGRNA
jgi:preprotein translocase subunit SecA